MMPKSGRDKYCEGEMGGKEAGEALCFVRIGVKLLMRQADGFVA
jgi:hypothetical protein